MPAPIVSIDNSKKHYTAEEKNRRSAEEKVFSRPKVNLRAPASVKADPAAEAYWKKLIKAMKGISLLDDVDAEMLGRYCLLSARLDLLNDNLRKGLNQGFCDDEILKRIEATERNLLSYAQKLGLTPDGRARLAKKKAEERPLSSEEQAEVDLYGC